MSDLIDTIKERTADLRGIAFLAKAIDTTLAYYRIDAKKVENTSENHGRNPTMLLASTLYRVGVLPDQEPAPRDQDSEDERVVAMLSPNFAMSSPEDIEVYQNDASFSALDKFTAQIAVVLRDNIRGFVEAKQPATIRQAAWLAKRIVEHTRKQATSGQNLVHSYPDALNEIENVSEQWAEGLTSDGEALTKLAYIQGHLSEAINKIILGINEREKNEAEARLQTMRENGL